MRWRNTKIINSKNWTWFAIFLLNAVLMKCSFCDDTCGHMELYACDYKDSVRLDRADDVTISADHDTLLIVNGTDDCLSRSAHLLSRMVAVHILEVRSGMVSLSGMIEVLQRANQTKVTWIEANECDLQVVLSRQFSQLQELDELDISRNNITRLEPFAFSNLSIEIINLSRNQLTTIPSNAFFNLTDLLRLDVSHNKLIHVDAEAFMHIQRHPTICMNDNHLDRIPYEALAAANVYYLYLHNNTIREIQKAIQTLRFLQSLDIQFNKLETISENTRNLSNLKSLYINNNNLTTLSAELADFFKNSLKKIDISSNPWKCDCDLLWLLSLVHSESGKFIGQKKPRCVYPSSIHMENVSLYCDVGIEEIADFSIKLHQPIVLAVVFLFSVCVLITVVCLCLNRASQKFKPIPGIRLGLLPPLDPRMMIDNEKYLSVRSSSAYSSASDEFTDKSAETCQPTADMTGKIRLSKLLGRGAFGEVYEGFTVDSSSVAGRVAVKKIKDSTSLQERAVLEEELKQLVEIGKHPNIVGLIGYGIRDGSLFIVMELAELGDLHSYLRKLELTHRKEIDGMDTSEHATYLLSKHPQLFVFMWSVSKGMEYLTRLKIIHRDLAARNILLTKGLQAKISDFGLSRDLYEFGYYYMDSKGRLPYKWMSPEALMNGKYTIKSDVWSFGVLLWEVVTLGCMPYPGIPPDMLMELYKTEYVMPKPSLCPEKIYQIMKQCWRYDVNGRPSFQSLVEQLDKCIQEGKNLEYLQV